MYYPLSVSETSNRSAGQRCVVLCKLYPICSFSREEPFPMSHIVSYFISDCNLFQLFSFYTNCINKNANVRNTHLEFYVPQGVIFSSKYINSNKW